MEEGTSFESIRHGINRYLKSPPHDKKFDIVKDSDFTDPNTNFQGVQVNSYHCQLVPCQLKSNKFYL